MIFYNLSLEDFIPAFIKFSLLEALIRGCPNIKMTLFISLNSAIAKGNSLYDNPHWCSLVRMLPSKNVELAYHGWGHHLKNAAKTPEFALLSEEESIKLLQRCECAAYDIGLPFTKGFRPPRWKISRGCVKALERLNYLYLAGHPFYEDAYQGTNLPCIFFNSDIHHNTNRKWRYGKWLLIYKEELPDIAKYYLHRGHFISKGLSNLTPKTVNNILRTIRSLAPVQFVFLSELATMMRMKNIQRL